MCQSRSPILSLIEYLTRLPITTQLSNSCRRYLYWQTKLPGRNRTIPTARRTHSVNYPVSRKAAIIINLHSPASSCYMQLVQFFYSPTVCTKRIAVLSGKQVTNLAISAEPTTNARICTVRMRQFCFPQFFLLDGFISTLSAHLEDTKCWLV